MLDICLIIPHRYSQFERGRVLVSFNTSSENTITPWLRDDLKNAIPAPNYCDNPSTTSMEAKELKDTYFETFDHFEIDKEGQPNYKDPEAVILPYVPYFSSCRGYDSYIPLYSLFESDSCSLPDASWGVDPSWARLSLPPFPHQDDIVVVNRWDVFKEPIADLCVLSIDCQYEEDLTQATFVPRWFEAATDEVLFDIMREPITFSQYSGRKETRTSLSDTGGGGCINWNVGDDFFVPVKVDRSEAFSFPGGCSRQCFPREMLLDVKYYQKTPHEKQIVDIRLILKDFDKDETSNEYKLKLHFHALDYWNLIKYFAFDWPVFVVLFVVIGCISVAVAFIYWLVVRFSTQIVSPPPLRFWGMFWLIFPPALSGVILGLIPISAMTAVVYLVVYGHPWLKYIFGFLGSESSTWILDNVKLHFMESGVSNLTEMGTKLALMMYTTYSRCCACISCCLMSCPLYLLV